MRGLLFGGGSGLRSRAGIQTFSHECLAQNGRPGGPSLPRMRELVVGRDRWARRRAYDQVYSRGREREGIGFACTGPIDGSIFRLQ